MLSVSPDRMWSPEVVLGAGAVVILLVLSRYRTGRQYARPPGPRPIPILGNLFDMPSSQYAVTWARLGQKYGPVTWLTIPGQNFLILNSMEAARELLDKRGSIYVDRPRWVMAGELMGLDFLTPLSRFNIAWRKHRSLLKHSLSAEVVKRDYSSQLTKKAHQYLHCLLTRPDDFLVDLGRIVAENIIELTYGNRTDDKGRDLVELNFRVIQTILHGMQGYVVDMLPSCELFASVKPSKPLTILHLWEVRHLPSWLPGMNFKRDAVKWRAEIEEAKQTVFGFAKRSLDTASPSSDSSFMINNLRELYQKHEDSVDVGQLEEDELAISNTGFSFFLAGVETEKVHAEIDAVVGSQRPPTFDDQPNMPYLHAVLLETLRWNPVVSMGLPHASLEDDIYGEYHIPKGTTVIGNGWGISRNTQYYKEPSTFDPERYLKPNPDLDPRHFAFGFGRRICPGNELAYQAMWINAASILWAFKLKRTEDDTAALDEDLERFSFGTVKYEQSPAS